MDVNNLLQRRELEYNDAIKHYSNDIYKSISPGISSKDINVFQKARELRNDRYKQNKEFELMYNKENEEINKNKFLNYKTNYDNNIIIDNYINNQCIY